MRTVSGRDAVAAILSDPEHIVPPVPPAGPVGTLAWLRATVCRFAEGEAHARRRALVEARLAAIDPDGLARDGSPVRALARALGMAGDVEAAVAAVADAYLTGGPGADAAVAALVAAAGPGDPEAVAADISILVQAARATAAMIEGRDPPVPATRRIGPDGEVELDLTGLPFGAGRHGCPGERHARALAEPRMCGMAGSRRLGL
jgi:hypothetical protein